MTPMDDVDEQLEVDAETAANLIAIQLKWTSKLMRANLEFLADLRTLQLDATTVIDVTTVRPRGSHN
jgi:hypothetical protein